MFNDVDTHCRRSFISQVHPQDLFPCRWSEQMYLTTKLTPVCAGDSHECMLPVKSGFDQDFDWQNV